jgi:prevent-host-death family protein
MKEQTLPISDFKARCLRLLEELAERGETIVVTKHGKPIARIVPFQSESPPLKGRWEGQGKTKGDIVYFDTSSEWEALR